MKNTTSKAIIAEPPTPTPTPMPVFAPFESPEEEPWEALPVDVDVGVSVVEVDEGLVDVLDADS